MAAGENMGMWKGVWGPCIEEVSIGLVGERKGILRKEVLLGRA